MQEKKGETGMLSHIKKFICIACIAAGNALYKRTEHTAEKGCSRQLSGCTVF